MKLSSKILDIDWKREWFPRVSKYPKTYWNSFENCRKFMEVIASGAHIRSPSEWRKVSFALIKSEGGMVRLAKNG